MKTRINLYPSDAKSDIDLLSFNFLIAVWSICTLGIAGGAYLTSEMAGTSGQALESIQRQFDQQSGVLDTLTKGRDSVTIDTELEARLATQQMSVSTVQTAYRQVAEESRQKSTRPSQSLRDLSNFHQSGLWITQLTQTAEGYDFRGVTVDAANVPKWVTGLAQSEAFGGQAFAQARIQRRDGQLHFHLSSSYSAEEDLAEAAEVSNGN